VSTTQAHNTLSLISDTLQLCRHTNLALCIKSLCNSLDFRYVTALNVRPICAVQEEGPQSLVNMAELVPHLQQKAPTIDDVTGQVLLKIARRTAKELRPVHLLCE
jgi:hypothetical protein